MFCGKCGIENQEGMKFCKGCGHPLETAGGQQPGELVSGSISPETAARIVLVRQQLRQGMEQIIRKGKTIPRRFLIGGIAVVVAIAGLIGIGSARRKTIHLNKYLIVEAAGYDGYGTASISVDWDAMEEKYGDVISFTEEAKDLYGGYLVMMTPMKLIQDSISVSLEENSGFSNGDKVAYTWEIEEEALKYVDAKITYDNDTHTVSDLSEISSFDAFTGVDMQFSGVAPNGMAELTSSGERLDIYHFMYENRNGLKNGDTIEVTLSNTDMEYYVSHFGQIPEATSKTYTVSGLQEYVMEYADLTGDFLAALKKETEDTIYAYAASSYSAETSLKNLEYAGYILNTFKEGSGYTEEYNHLYIIYKGEVSSSDGSFPMRKVYFPVKFSNMIKGDGGELSYSDHHGVSGSSELGRWHTTRGYMNPLVCYGEIVESSRDRYQTECGDGFERYAEYESIKTLQDIDGQWKETMYADAKDRVASYIGSNYDSGSVVENLSYAGEYLLIAKSQGNNFKQNNRYIVVYSATVSSAKGKFATTTVYFPVRYDGIVKLPDGEYFITDTVGIMGNSILPDSLYYTTAGYVSGEEMHTAVLTANRDNYTYDISAELKMYEK